MRKMSEFVDFQDLLDEVLNQLAVDIERSDFTAIEELLKKVPKKDLLAYLPEEV